MAKHPVSLTNNLVEPLVFTYADGLRFCRDNVCIECRTNPSMSGWEGSFAQDRCHVRCFRCKKDLREGEYISVEEAKEAARNQRVGEREMEDEKPRMSTEQAMKDLGF